MARLRSLSCPKATTSHHRIHEDSMPGAQSPLTPSMTHSRDSSAASTASSPLTPTFSARGHGQWSSSNSSVIASAPESPINLSKSPLGDLVEQPEEREIDEDRVKVEVDVEADIDTDYGYSYYNGYENEDENEDEDDISSHLFGSVDQHEEPETLCICDAPFCDHSATPKTLSTVVPSNDFPEWMPGDDSNLFSHRSPRIRESGDSTSEWLSSRFGHRWSVLSKRWRDHQPTTSLSIASVRSAPPSRTSSLRLPSIKRSLASALDSIGNAQPSFDVSESQEEDDNDVTARKAPPPPLFIPSPAPLEESTDGAELSTTPLLPPMPRAPSGHMHGDTPGENTPFRSPLQSPTVIASDSDAISALKSPASTTAFDVGSPPSSPESLPVSAYHNNSMTNLSAAPDTSPATFALEPDSWVDSWTFRLGHANYRIFPRPYMPESCTQTTCKRLLDDWEIARTEYMRHARQVSENYGPTSMIYKLTEQKWEEIDATWRENHESANLRAGASGESLPLRPLAETAPIRRMPSLNDPTQPDKFPMIDAKDVVGPMVQHAKIAQQAPTKKPVLLRIFTDPGSLLPKSTSALKREQRHQA